MVRSSRLRSRARIWAASVTTAVSSASGHGAAAANRLSSRSARAGTRSRRPGSHSGRPGRPRPAVVMWRSSNPPRPSELGKQHFNRANGGQLIMDNSHLQHVIYVFGTELVQWALNLRVEQATGEDLNAEQKMGLADLAQLAARLIPPHSVPIDLIPNVLRPDDHWAELRAACGAAQLRLAPTGDPLADSLLALADLAYPILLVASGRNNGRHRQSSVSLPWFRGHAAQSFLRALQNDPLGALFPSVSELEGTDSSCPLSTPFVKQMTVQRVLFASTLLRQAWITTVFRGTWDQDGYRQAAIEALRTIRSAHQGLPTQTSLFLGFSNCAIPKDLQCGEITLHPFRGGPQLGLIPNQAWPARLGGANTWLSFIAEIPVDYFLNVAEPGQVGGGQIGTQEVYALAEKWGSDIALAVTLAGIPLTPLRHHEMRKELPSPPAPTCSWHCFVELVDQNGMSSMSSETYGSSTELTENDLAAAAIMLQRIRSGASDSIRIAAHRVLMGAQRPRHAEDRLVDAVIAWENIAGDTRDAVKLKTCAVLAYLISDVRSRASVRSELEVIYGVRNGIVHGLTGKERTAENLWSHANRALDVALRALRALLTDRLEWLPIKKRFEHMYLGDDPNHPV